MAVSFGINIPQLLPIFTLIDFKQALKNKIIKKILLVINLNFVQFIIFSHFLKFLVIVWYLFLTHCISMFLHSITGFLKLWGAPRDQGRRERFYILKKCSIFISDSSSGRCSSCGRDSSSTAFFFSACHWNLQNLCAYPFSPRRRHISLCEAGNGDLK